MKIPVRVGGDFYSKWLTVTASCISVTFRTLQIRCCCVIFRSDFTNISAMKFVNLMSRGVKYICKFLLGV